MKLAETFRTPRLLLTRFAAEDAGDLVAMHRNPRVAEALGRLPPDAGAHAAAAQALAAHWDEHGFGWWTVREPATGRFIGRGGLRFLTLGAKREIEAGFGLIPEFWGRGLATELVRVAVAQGIVRLGTDEIVGITLPANAASRRVMEKAGFTLDREIARAGLPHVLYRIAAQAWRAPPAARARPAEPQAPAEQAVAA